jgi:hypothetical protein
MEFFSKDKGDKKYYFDGQLFDSNGAGDGI